MDPALKTNANRIRGCFSQVWVDAQLTKGLAALLVLGLSGALARDVAMVPVEFQPM